MIFFFIIDNRKMRFPREIISHRSLRHPNIVTLKEVCLFVNCGRLCFKVVLILKLVNLIIWVILTPTHLAIVMEYASRGELFERICNVGRFPLVEVCS